MRFLVTEHLLTERLELYSRKKLEAAEMVAINDHLATCEFCSLRLRKIAPPQEAIQKLKARALAAAQEESAPASQREPVKGVRFLFWWGQLLPTLGSVPVGLRVAAIAATVALVTWSVAIWWRGKPENQPLIVLHASPSPTVFPSVNPAASPTTPANPSPSPVTSPTNAAVHPRTEIALNDGTGQLRLNKEGNLEGLPAQLSPADESIIRSALLTENVQLPRDLPEFPIQDGSTRGSSDSITAVSPVGVKTLSARPTFRWKPADGGATYEVTIFEPISKASHTSPALSAAEWTSDIELKRGVTYQWQVAARIVGKELTTKSPAANFQPLEKAQADKIDQVRRDYSGWHLILGSLYTKAGLLDEAEAEFQELRKANPDLPIAQRLLRHVEALRPR